MSLKSITITLAAAAGLLLPAINGYAETRVGIKTNLISDVALSPNLGIEAGLAPKWSMELVGQLNLWKIDGRSWKHAYLLLEPRYWFCDRFAGHFIGLHVLGGTYNFGNLNIPYDFLGSNLKNLKDKRYQGWAYGVGASYGYAWPLAKHWNIEAELGIGWLHTKFDSYPCTICGTAIEKNKPHNYFGITKTAVNLVYLF